MQDKTGRFRENDQLDKCRKSPIPADISLVHVVTDEGELHAVLRHGPAEALPGGGCAMVFEIAEQFTPVSKRGRIGR